MRDLRYIFLLCSLYISAALAQQVQCPLCTPLHPPVVNFASHVRRHEKLIRNDSIQQNITVLEKSWRKILFQCSGIQKIFILEDCRYHCGTFTIHASENGKRPMQEHEIICPNQNDIPNKMSLEYILNHEKKA